MRYAKVVATGEKTAKVIFQDLNIQMTVLIAKGVEVTTGDKAIVVFETDLIGGVIVGVI